MTSFLLGFSFLILLVNGQIMQLTLFPNNTVGGQCLDGSPAGFYYSPPPSGSSNLWVIQMAGGGSCHDEKSCMKRANESLGSSNYWPTTKNGEGALSSNPLINPDFYSGHHVFCPYCNGDVWTGQRYEPSSNPDTWGLYFSGHLVFQSIVGYLENDMNSGVSLLNAQYVLLTGGSAGGLGTFMNIDWLSHELKELGVYENITIKGAPYAGWFFPGNTTDQLSNPQMPPNDYPHWINNENGGEGHNNSINILWDSYLPPTCVESLGVNKSWHCGSVHNLYPYIETPIFVMENKYDTNQLENQFLLPKNTVNNETTGYVEYFGNDMDRSIITQLVDEQNNKNGLFYASCFDHGEGLGIGNHKLTTINGYNSSALVGDWFWERNKFKSHIVYDTCNNNRNQLPCNPTCDTYPPN